MFLMQTWAATKLDKASEVAQPCRLRGLAGGYSIQIQFVMGIWVFLWKSTDIQPRTNQGLGLTHLLIEFLETLLVSGSRVS